ncbi:DUF2997 domain-containing protein [Leptolyngbya sp. AN02str]|uniref:DUF2997 domain-containing protein n=1 Tax=Leptolyngbya sp. AN02str TaxID=3423363 RepID=UPI003D31AFC8
MPQSQPQHIEFIVSFDDEYQPKIEVVNGDGASCLKETQALEEALGEVTSREMKPSAIVRPQQQAQKKHIQQRH